MIAMLKGEVVVVDLGANYIILNTSRSVGYEVHLTSPMIEKLSGLESTEVELFIFTVYKENDVTLYGFETLEERDMFAKLLTVKGVGPSTALTILSEMSYNELAKALVAEDVERFMQIKGIGKTTAENIVSKLRRG